MRRAFLLVAALLTVATPLWADDGVTVNIQGRDAFSRPLPALDPARRAAFQTGRSLFQQVWTVGPSEVRSDLDGLGPLFNRQSCIACHAKSGRGEPPEGEGDSMRSTLVRLSVPGGKPGSAPEPHPVYGDQFNPDGIPGVPGEGRATLVWSDRIERLDDGTVVNLRTPSLLLRDLAYGPLGAGVMTSVRMAPPVIGLGLLEAVPEADLLARADPDDRDGDEVRGRPNWVWDTARGAFGLGRFGLKANQPSLCQQNAGAFDGDLGLTSSLFPGHGCTASQAACQAAAGEGGPELSDAQLDAVTLYTQALAVPARRNADDPLVRVGEGLFAAIGCAACHTPTLRTGPFPALPELASREIHPYTDLLLHDLGEGLADGRPDFQATGRQWRTPPLWGLGLTAAVADRAAYLHDGRARSPLEAILWHGGEAEAAGAAVRRMPSLNRKALLAFLDSL
ncbi:di-heme oxidoredictase family protein [Azospirillum doebereinerae]|uniref:di-heme oxidoreductase family protein n=1 Tax=Azospirillum doebereinerae TaxID=92933 RepID=UPI001EE55C9D|nr:di-heme oxidoredictase family protein [Azospirillum doebereinerae]MCG5240513.1 thiol oxidoreductase [Azospirillum doebereinerae]